MKVGALMNLEASSTFVSHHLIHSFFFFANKRENYSNKRSIRGILPASIRNCCRKKIFITTKGRPSYEQQQILLNNKLHFSLSYSSGW